MGADTQVGHQQQVIFFDGVCNLCNSSVNFIIDRDPYQKFHFASLQSGFAQEKLDDLGADPRKLESIVLLRGDHVFNKSSAVVRIAAQLPGLWPLLSVFWIIPKPIRNWIYDFIATNRYRWFGKRDSCRMPSPELKQRFLDS